MISRSLHFIIFIFLAVASSPVSTTGSDPEVGLTVPVLEFSDLEVPAAAVFLALRQAALTYVQATQGWADAVRPLLLADPRVAKGAPASEDSGTSPSPGYGQTAAPAAPTTTVASPDAAAVSRYRSLSEEEKGERLIKAAKEGAVGELEALLAAGADVAATDGDRMTALHWAAVFGHVEAARRLLACGAAVDARTSVQMTPLHFAAFWGHAAVARLLLAASAQHGARDERGWTPLHLAAYNGRAEAAAALLEAGADRAARDDRGQTPLDMARRSNNQQLVDLLTAT